MLKAEDILYGFQTCHARLNKARTEENNTEILLL